MHGLNTCLSAGRHDDQHFLLCLPWVALHQPLPYALQGEIAPQRRPMRLDLIVFQALLNELVQVALAEEDVARAQRGLNLGSVVTWVARRPISYDQA